MFAGERSIPTSSEGRTISGYAIMFNVASQLLSDGFGRYVEYISDTALTQDDLSKFDVRALLEHDANRLLARWKRGEGTLKLEVDEIGLKYTFEAPHTPDGDTALELVKRGDLFGSSFSFLPDEESVIWGEDASGYPTRTITKIIYLDDVSIVSNPAYLQTSVSANELRARGYKPNDVTETDEMKEYISSARKAADEAANGFGK